MRWTKCKLGIASGLALVLINCDDWHVWDDVFDRRPASGTRGWTGGDGAVGVPLPGNRTLWIFGDSFVSGYDPSTGNRTGIDQLANITLGNTIGCEINTTTPDPAQIDFYARQTNPVLITSTSDLVSHFGQFFDWGVLGLPQPASPWGFWPNGGMCVNCTDGDPSNDRALISLSEIVSCDPTVDGACIPMCKPGTSPCTVGVKPISTALELLSNISGPPTQWTFSTATKITTNVSWGVAFVDDGANGIYVYGTELHGTTNLYVAKATVSTLLTPSQWQYWIPNGSGGIFQTLASQPSLSQLKIVAANIGAIPSVSKITRRNITKYVLVHDYPTGDHFLYVRTSSSPTSWGAVDRFTPKADMAAMDTSIQWVQLTKYTQGKCSPWVHNGESDFRACGTTYHGTAHPHISATDSFGISGLYFSYIVPTGADDTATSQSYYRPKFGSLPMDNLPDWCGAAGQPCWYGIGRLYNTRSIGSGQSQYFAFDVSQAAGLAFPQYALSTDLLGGSGNPDLYVKFGSTPPTTSSYDCRSNSSGSGESCRIAVPAGATTAQVMVYGAAAGTYSLRVAYVGS